MSLFTRGKHRKPKTDAEAQTPDLTDEPEESRTATRGGLSIIGNPHRNLVVDRSGTWAWFLMGETSWLCIDDDRSSTTMSNFAHRLAGFTGHAIKFRVTSSPFDSYSWAKDIDSSSPAPDPAEPRTVGDRTRLADVEDGETFAEMLEATQIRQMELDARTHAVAFAVRLTIDRLDGKSLAKLFSPKPLPDNEGALEALRRKLGTFTKEVERQGIKGRPLSPDELAWLFHASAGMGAPVPPMLIKGVKDEWWKSQVAAFTAPVYATNAPFAGSTTVRTLRNGAQFTNHVVVLHAVDFGGRDLDDRSLMPFLAWPQTLDFAVEVVAEFELIPGREKKATAERNRRIGQSIEKHYLEHGEDAPRVVERGIERAREVEDEVTTGDRITSVRAHGHVLLAVHAETEDDALDLAKELTALASEQQDMTLVQGYGQYASYRAFIPSEPMPVAVGLDTEMSLRALATSVPHASVGAGDEFGAYMGPVHGGHDLFLMDFQGGSRANKSNVVAVIGEQGSGKSTFGGYALAWNARLGRRAVGNDPSGMWQNLCKVPWLRNDARHLDLFECKPGTLTPSLMVPDPRPGNYETTEEFDSAVEEARRERMQLTIDALRNLVPHALLTSVDGGRIVGALRQAVTDAGGHYGMNPWDVVNNLREQGGVGPEVAAQLEAASKLKGGTLIFPPLWGETDDDYIASLMEQATLTIVTMKGISHAAKSNTDRASWNEDQQQSVALLDLAGRFSTRVVYADKKPKVVWNDELGLTGGVGAGSFAQSMGRYLVDSRKWNACIGILGQNPGMFTRLDEEISNLLGQVWTFRLKKEVARAALPLIGLPDGYRYEEVIAGLDNGQALVSDWKDRNPVVTIDQGAWDKDLLAALDTNPERDNTVTVRGRRLGVSA